MAEDLLTYARQAYTEGRLDDSESAFAQLAEQTGSQHAEGSYGMGVIRFQRGDLRGAERWFLSVVDEQPKHANAFYFLGEIAARQGSNDIAIARLGMALAVLPTHSSARRRMAALLNAQAEMPEQSGKRVERAPRTSPPHAASDPKATVGVAFKVSKGFGPWRGKPAALQIWHFRVQTYDAQGNPERMVGVEMRGHEITGSLENGDWVEISERPNDREAFQPKELRNLTTNDVVRSRMRWFMAT